MANSSPHRWDKVWIVGASTGIGKELALAIAPRCREVWISARSQDKLLEVASHANNIRVLPVDINDVQQVTDAARTIEQAGDGTDHSSRSAIDLVVVSSAVGLMSRLPKFDVDLYRRSMETNYMGTVHTISAVLPLMAEQGRGHIAMIASVAGYRGLPNGAPYSPTKAALINLAECIYPQLKMLGVAVSVICPGFVETPMTENNKFKMPFLIKADDAARRIVKGLDRRAYEIAFPWRMVYMLKFFRILPHSIFFRVAGRLMLVTPQSRQKT